MLELFNLLAYVVVLGCCIVLLFPLISICLRLVCTNEGSSSVKGQEKYETVDELSDGDGDFMTQ